MKFPVIVLFLFLAFSSRAFSRSGNPPDAKTGAPGEGTCRDCHSTYPLNSGDGAFVISGPSQFEGGQTYPITVEISDPGQSRWGFEITPLDIGTIVITDPVHTQQSSSGGRIYVKQTSTGTYNGNSDGPVSWSFDWTAPADPPQQVIFYAAGLAANGNGSISGDYVYTTSFTSDAAQNVPTLSEWGMIIFALLLLGGGTAAAIHTERKDIHVTSGI